MMDSFNPADYIACVTFHETNLSNFTYALRFMSLIEWGTSGLAPRFEDVGPRNASSQYGGAPGKHYPLSTHTNKQKDQMTFLSL